MMNDDLRAGHRLSGGALKPVITPVFLRAFA
jgi:hypothetical protein